MVFSARHVKKLINNYFESFYQLALLSLLKESFFGQQVDDLMILEITEKILQENAFEQKKIKETTPDNSNLPRKKRSIYREIISEGSALFLQVI